MSLQCRIVYNQDNTINYLETPQGDRSELFDELVQVMGGDKNSALNLYALTESEDFKTLYNGYVENKPVSNVAQTINIVQELKNIKDRAIAEGTFMKAPNGKPTNLNEQQWLQVRTQEFKNWFGDWQKAAYDYIEGEELNLSESLTKNNVSQVIDKKTFEPLIVFHGSPYSQITEFNRESSVRQKSGLKEFGTYFATNIKLSEKYSKGNLSQEYLNEVQNEINKWKKVRDSSRSNRDFDAAEREIELLENSKKGKVYPVFLNLKSIKEFNAKGESNIEAWNNLQVDAGYKTAKNRDAMEFLKEGKFGVEKVDGIHAKNIVDAFTQGVEKLDKELIGDVFLVFDGKENLIKSAEENIGAFSTETNDIRFRKGENKGQLAEKEVINRLKESGLGANVFELNTKDIITKSEELGVENTTQIINGFVHTQTGNIYLNYESVTNETALHEFSHLYNYWLKDNKPELYNKGIELVKAELTKEKSDIIDIIDYVKSTQPNLKEEALLEEILTELTGRKGAELLEAKKGGIVDWLRDVWSEIAKILGLTQMSPAQVANLTLGQYAEAIGADLLRGENFKVEQKTQEYLDRINAIKQQDPDNYWSVDVPSEAVVREAVKNDRLVEVYGGMAIVEQDGNMIGLFKDKPDAKNVAKDLQRMRIEKGGIKTDNFNGYLTKLYEKNGFKVASRVAFNEEIAPPGWSKEKHGTPDVVFMIYDPNNSLKIEEKSFTKDQYNEAQSYRDSYVESARQVYSKKLSENKTGKTQSFFSDVVEGKSDKFKAKKDWVQLLSYTKLEEAFNKVYSKFKGNFDNHIATSIPTFRETQVKVGSALANMLPKNALIYDIGGSEGGFIKAITEVSKGAIKSINLDVNESMQKAHEASPVKGSTFVNEAFYESYEDEDTGKVYKKHVPSKKADVVHESMVFQFITPERRGFIEEVKNAYLKTDGILLLEEKLVPSTDEQWLASERKKDSYKLNYYTQEEISGKAEQVLLGMRQNQTQEEELVNILQDNFSFVREYWDAGNFKGYIATNSKDKGEQFLDNLGGKITSEYSTDNLKDTPLPKKLTAEDVLTYANSTNDVLTTQQIIDLQDVIMSLGVDNSLQAEEMLNKALVFKGVVTFNKKRMLDSGAFNSYEVSEILSNPERQKTLKKVLQALKNTEIIELEYPKENVKTKQEINSFGKQSVENPFIEEVQGKEVEVLTVDSLGNLSKKTTGSDTQAILENTVIEKSNIKLSENIEFLKDISPAVWNGNRKAISKILEEIKEDAIENGIDLKNFSEKAYTKSRGQILDFLQDLEVAEFDVLAGSYNEMFDLNTPVTETINTESEFDIYMEDNISEYDAFKEFSLIKKAPNIYRKVADKPLEELYRIAAINNKKTVEEVQKEVRENPINLPTFEGDTEVLEKIKLYKQHFKFQENTTAYKEEPQSREYIQKANKWLLKTKNPYYKITAKGLETVSNDPLTKMRAEMTLPKDLVIDREEDFTDENLSKRKEYFYNVQLLEKLNSDYAYLEDQVIAVRNNEDSFIKTPKGVAEIVYKNGNVSFYSLVQENLEKPGTDINFRKFEYLETTPEVFKKPKNYYTKEELKEINNKNFACN